MNYQDAIQRCYEIVDRNRSYIDATRGIRKYETSPLCTNFIQAVQHYVADTIYPFVSELSNRAHNGAPVDTDWVENNVQRFEQQTECNQSTLEMLKTLPIWSMH